MRRHLQKVSFYGFRVGKRKNSARSSQRKVNNLMTCPPITSQSWGRFIDQFLKVRKLTNSLSGVKKKTTHIAVAEMNNIDNGIVAFVCERSYNVVRAGIFIWAAMMIILG